MRGTRMISRRKLEEKEHECDFSGKPSFENKTGYKTWNCKYAGCRKWADNWKELKGKESPKLPEKLLNEGPIRTREWHNTNTINAIIDYLAAKEK